MNYFMLKSFEILGKIGGKTTDTASLDKACNDTELQQIVNVAKFVLTAIQWLVPVLLIIWGTIDLVKAVVAGKEEDIKKNQKILIKRLISAVIVFLLPVAVSIIMGLIGSKEWKSCWTNAEPEINLNVEDK